MLILLEFYLFNYTLLIILSSTASEKHQSSPLSIHVAYTSLLDHNNTEHQLEQAVDVRLRISTTQLVTLKSSQ